MATGTCPPECFRPDAGPLNAVMLRLSVWVFVALTLSFAAATRAQHITLSIDDLEAPGFSAKALKGGLRGTAERELLLEIGAVTLYGRTWRNVRLRCPRLRLETAVIECAAGVIEVGEAIPLSFTYSAGQKKLDVVLQPAAREIWRLNADFGKREFRVGIDNGKPERLASWLPPEMPKPSGGTIKGAITFLTAGSVNAQIEVDGLAFSDASGLRAGEKIKAGIRVAAEQRDGVWQWRASADWVAGEVFWQPLYVTGSGQRLEAEGISGAQRTQIRRGSLTLPAVGSAEFNGVWDHKTEQIINADVRSTPLKLSALYAQVLKPFLAQTALGDVRTAGEVTAAVQIAQGKLGAVDLQFKDVSLEDHNRRFALFGMEGRIPWQQDAATQAEISVKGGEVLRLPFGPFRLPLNMRGTHFAVDKLDVPLLDARLTVSDFSAGLAADGWRWSFGGGLTPVSLSRFTQSLGLPTMHGSLSGVIPRMTYEKSTLSVDGALLFRVFDGTIVAKDLRLLDPFGKVPRMQADLDMRNLDLDLLTRTFSFGNITGRIDAQVTGMELINWQPVKFDARVESSAGDYPRKISQTAVQNISALGGAGAAAAIQRSFLRFFEQFGYQKIGLKCKLRNYVCEMSGAEDAPQGYVIVKGGGIPAITVIGYNRYVSWQELIDRLKRIMQDNVHAIVE
ncbi:MAG: hypothetical protein Q8L40_00905 [Burkholderiales bacterium]|nr:hypothetical protein [Burkholderiales bacterium]